MGHQESLLFCDSKSDMLRLCKLLNRAASDSSERGLEYAGLDIFEVARLKQTVKTKLPGEEKGPIFTAGCYAVWWLSLIHICLCNSRKGDCGSPGRRK